jgi:creatininase
VIKAMDLPYQWKHCYNLFFLCTQSNLLFQHPHSLWATMKHTTAFATELTWPDYHAAVRDGQTPILIPIGSMEQHGHHMPLHVDVLLPTEFARRVALETGALVAPPFTYGYKSHQKSGGGNHLPGTTSLDGATLVASLKDVVKSFAMQGVRKICLVNGHFENSWFIVEAIDLALRELRWDGITDLKVVVLSYWDFVHKEAIAQLYPGGFPAGTWNMAGCWKLRSCWHCIRIWCTLTALSTIRRPPSRPMTSIRSSRSGRPARARCPRQKRRRWKRAISFCRFARPASSARCGRVRLKFLSPCLTGGPVVAPFFLAGDYCPKTGA